MTVHSSTIHVALASLQGGRSVQQDALSFRQHGHLADGGYLVAAVADGLGSVEHSELIARAAAEAATTFGARIDCPDDPAHLIELAATAVGLHAATAEQWKVFDAFEYGGHGRPDTTLVVVTATTDGEVHAGWVGDCRAYLRLADRRLIRLTDDHNLAEYGRPHVVTRTLASPGPGPENSHWHAGTDPDHRVLQVLLTSDGVHEALSDAAIAHALATAARPERAVAWLTGWAVRAAGEHADNATALLLTLPDPATAAHARGAAQAPTAAAAQTVGAV